MAIRTGTKFNSGGEAGTSAKSAEGSLLSRRVSARPMKLLIGLLLALLVVASIRVYPSLRQNALTRQSLDSLRKQALRSESDVLTRYVYAERLFESAKTTKQDSEVLTAFQRAEAALSPDSNDALAEAIHAHEGYLLASASMAKEAVPHLERARKLDENDPLVFLGSGQLLEQQGRFDAAVAQYRFVVGLDAHNAEAWFRLGRCANADRKPQEAIEPLDRALALRPDVAAYHAELGHAFAFQRQFADALPHFRQALALEPGNPDYERYCGIALSECARNDAEYREAVSLLTQSLRGDPDNTNLLYALGTLHLRFNQPALAEPALQKCVQLATSYTDGWYNLSLAQKQLGHTAQYQKSNARFQALALARNQQQVLEKKVQVLTTDPALRLALARHYRKQGNLVGAAQQYDYALHLETHSPQNAEIAREAQTLNAQIRKLTTEQGIPLAQLGALGPPLTAAPVPDTEQARP